MRTIYRSILALAVLASTACTPGSEPGLGSSSQEVLLLNNNQGVLPLSAGDNNDVDMISLMLLEAHASGSRLTGVTQPGQGEGITIVIRNQSTTRPLTLAHQNTGSTQGNRFRLYNGRDLVLAPYEMVWLEWDVADDCWIALDDGSLRGVVSTSTSTRALATAFQPSVLRPTMGYYSARIVSTITLSGGEAGRIELLSDSANPPTTVRGRCAGGATGTVVLGLSLNDTAECQLSYLVPAGDYVLLRSVTESGTPAYSLTAQAEQTL